MFPHHGIHTEDKRLIPLPVDRVTLLVKETKAGALVLQVPRSVPGENQGSTFLLSFLFENDATRTFLPELLKMQEKSNESSTSPSPKVLLSPVLLALCGAPLAQQ